MFLKLSNTTLTTYPPSDKFKENQNGALWMVGCWYAEPDKPTTCRLNQLYAGKTGIATSNLLVLLLVAVPVAGLLIYQLAGIWLGFGLRRCKYCWLLVAGGRKPYRPTPTTHTLITD
jgi:hypothetical protein